MHPLRRDIGVTNGRVNAIRTNVTFDFQEHAVRLGLEHLERRCSHESLLGFGADPDCRWRLVITIQIRDDTRCARFIEIGEDRVGGPQIAPDDRITAGGVSHRSSPSVWSGASLDL